MMFTRNSSKPRQWQPFRKLRQNKPLRRLRDKMLCCFSQDFKPKTTAHQNFSNDDCAVMMDAFFASVQKYTDSISVPEYTQEMTLDIEATKNAKHNNIAVPKKPAEEEPENRKWNKTAAPSTQHEIIPGVDIDGVPFTEDLASQITSESEGPSDSEGQFTDELGSEPEWMDDFGIASTGSHLPDIIAGRWKIGAEVGFGGCGKIFGVKDIETGEVLVLKSEPQQVKQPTVPTEIEVYKALKKASPRPVGFPRMHYHGKVENQNFFIMDFLGEPLGQILDNSESPLPNDFILSFGMQAITRIEKLHSLGYVHGDINPNNFLMGRTDLGRVYLIDFGLSRRFRGTDGTHVKKDVSKFLPGVRIFASPHVLDGWVHSRRDDIISLGYCLIYMVNLDLPWIEINDFNDRAQKKDTWTVNCQRAIRMCDLCQRLPLMESFFEYANDLDFEDTPDYEYLGSLLLTGLRDKIASVEETP